MEWIYLDSNATTQPASEVVDAMDGAHRNWWANPSSVHRFGQVVRQKVELARAAVSALINARPREIIFTSGGTESNNLALAILRSPGSRVRSPESGDRSPDPRPPSPASSPVLVTTKIEHSSIREAAEAREEDGVDVVYLPVDRAGRVDPEDLRSVLEAKREADGPVLVSIHWANNETGVIQPVARLADLCGQCRKSGQRVLFHCDATQAVGKIPVDVKEAAVDLMTLSAHKFHGPKGAGALYVRRGVRVRRQIHGGPQEREKRGGTENAAGIIGMGAAAEAARRFLDDHAAIETLRSMRDRFTELIGARLPEMVINAQSAGPDGRLWNTSNLGFPALEAEAILLGLSERGVCASAGAACSSGSLEPSPVLLAMGITERVAHGSVRFSLSRFTTVDQIDRAAAIVSKVVERLGRTVPVGA